MVERTLPFELRAASRGWQTLRGAWLWLIGVRPLYLLSALAIVQWVALGLLVLSIHHNGWLFYQGGDQTYYYGTAWAFAHGHVAPTSIGYLWSLLEAPIALVAGPSFLVALPAIVLLQVLVLLPLGLALAYGLGNRIGGRSIATIAAVGWVIAPYVVIPGFVERFHAVYVDQVLPQALGLTALGDFPSMILVAAAVWCFARALDEDDDRSALLAGLLTGAAIGLKPANAPFVLGPALALVVVRRWRVGLVYAVSILPALVTLLIWKDRTLGHVPLVGSLAPLPGAAGTAAAAPVAAGGVHSYLHFDWAQIGNNMGEFREYFWSMRLVEWLPFAGVVAVARASLSKAALLGGWLAGFVIVKAASPAAHVQDGTFFRLLMPAWPAYLLLAASLPLLVPGIAARVRPVAAVPARRGLRLRTRPAVAALVLLVAIPFLAVVALPKLDERTAVADYNYNTLVTTTGDMHAEASVRGRTITLRWRPPAHGSSAVYYRLYVAPTTWNAQLGLPDSVDVIACDAAATSNAKCRLTPASNIGPLTSTRFVAKKVPPGPLTFRVAALANWRNDPTQGDTFLISEPVRVVVR